MSLKEPRSVFGTDGYRGAYPATIDEATVNRLAQAYGRWLVEAGHEPRIVVARDTRRSGPALACAAIEGAQAANIEVLYLDVAPTPVALKLAEQLGCSAIVLTASHNPEPDNGFKCTVGPDKTTADQEVEITKIFRQLATVPLDATELPPALNELRTRYIHQLCSNLESEFGKSPLAGKRIVLDCANGAAIDVGPAVFETLGAEVIRTPIGNNLDQSINDNCGATRLDNLTSYLQEQDELVRDPNFLMGIAFDGDADRMMAVMAREQHGSVETLELDGNRVLCIFAEGQPAVVGTCYTNPGARRALQAAGVSFIECDNGDKAVTAALAAHNLRFGSEFSGHHVDRTWLSSGDGMYASARLACLAARHGAEAFYRKASAITLDPNVMLNIPLDDIDSPSGFTAKWEQLLRASHPAVIVRASGTQSLLRIWASDPEPRKLQQSFDQICDEAGIARIQIGEAA